MIKRFLNILWCPFCRGDLELTVFEENREGVRGPEVFSGKDEVVEGLLKCTCGMTYPIIDGVPRLLEAGLGAFPKFLEVHRGKILAEMRADDLTQHAPTRESRSDYHHIRESFSKEWELFDYTGDKTWGWTLEDRKRVFLEDVAIPKSQLKGKLLLDAGCGNGTLTAALSSFGMDVVGIDLNDGLGAANRNSSNCSGYTHGHVYFVQGNLSNPPLRQGLFDLVYCSGVIHHTVNSKETFKKLVPLVKKGGRLYVWVYGGRSLPVRMFFDSGRQLKKFMSLESLLVTCRVIAPFFKVGTELLNELGVMKFRKRKIREITLDLFDAFAPEYNHRHTVEEVQGWLKEQAFTNVAVSGRQKHGFGVYGDKP